MRNKIKVPSILLFNLEKAFIHETTYTTKKGKLVHRKAYTDKRIAKKVVAKDKIRSPWTKNKTYGEVKEKLHDDRDTLKKKLEDVRKHKQELLEAKNQGKTHTEKGIAVDHEHHLNKHEKNLHEKLENTNHKIMLHDNHYELLRERNKEIREKAKAKRAEKRAAKKPQEKASDGLTFSSNKDYMDWYRKQSEEVKDDHKLNRVGDKLVVTLNGDRTEVKKDIKPAEKPVTIAKKEKSKESIVPKRPKTKEELKRKLTPDEIKRVTNIEKMSESARAIQFGIMDGKRVTRGGMNDIGWRFQPKVSELVSAKKQEDKKPLSQLFKEYYSATNKADKAVAAKQARAKYLEENPGSSMQDYLKAARDAKPSEEMPKSKAEEARNRSLAMIGNKNAYKGGPKEEPKKLREPKKVEVKKPVVEKKEDDIPKPGILPLEEITKLPTDKQKDYFGAIDERGYKDLQAVGQYFSAEIDKLRQPGLDEFAERAKKLQETQAGLSARKVRRNNKEYERYYDAHSKYMSDYREFNIETNNLKSQAIVSAFPSLEGNRPVVNRLTDKYGQSHGDFIRDMEKDGANIGLQNKRDYLIGDQKNWLTDKAIATTPKEYSEILGIDEDIAKDLPRAFGQNLLAKYSRTTFYSKPNTDFNSLLKEYWQKNKAKHSGRGIEVQHDKFVPKITEDENGKHHDYSNDDHGFILPDISTKGFVKFTKRELAGEGHETVKRAAKEFDELKKSLIKSESLDRERSDRFRPSKYKIDGGYQIVDGRIFMRVSVSRDKYIYGTDRDDPEKRPQTRKSFIYSPDVQLGGEGMIELKGGYKAEMIVQKVLYNQINHENKQSMDLLDEVRKIGGTYGAHDFFQKAEYNENTGLIESKLDTNGEKISANFPLSRFKMMLSFFNSVGVGGFVVPEKNLTRSVRDAMDIFRADQDASRERMSSTYYEAYLKGRETSFGTANISNDILDSHGVFIKRQNGDELSADDKVALEKVVDETYSAIGNKSMLSKIAKEKQLKVSFSGTKMAYLTKAVGLYVPSEGTVVIGKQMEKVLPHEFAHFMDDNMGDENKKGRGSYASEMQHTPAGKLTVSGRRTFTRASKKTQQMGGYWNRSCEIFARMVEQYAAVNHYKDESYYGRDGYWSKSAYEKVKPEIEMVLKEKFGKSFSMIFGTKIKIPKILLFGVV